MSARLTRQNGFNVVTLLKVITSPDEHLLLLLLRMKRRDFLVLFQSWHTNKNQLVVWWMIKMWRMTLHDEDNPEDGWSQDVIGRCGKVWRLSISDQSWQSLMPANILQISPNVTITRRTNSTNKSHILYIADNILQSSTFHSLDLTMRKYFKRNKIKSDISLVCKIILQLLIPH